MSLFIFIARVRSDKGVEVQCPYAGEDGAVGEAAYAKLVESGNVVSGHRYTNPTNGASLATDPTPTKATTPTFINKAKPHVTPKVAEPPKAIASVEEQVLRARKEEAEAQEKLRHERLNPTKPAVASEPVKNEAGLIVGGPTIEEYVAKGYKPSGYPPTGYAEVASPGLTQFREEQAKSAAQAAALAAAPSAPAAEQPKIEASAPVAQSSPEPENNAASAAPSAPAAAAEPAAPAAPVGGAKNNNKNKK